MAKNDRFQVILKEGNGMTSTERTVLVDSVTGVQYLFLHSGYAGGLCPLLDKDGKPMVQEM